MAHIDQNQNRGDLAAYDRYLRGMDTSMRQKVALTAAHLLGQGKIADMGMGSGLGSKALAALYPRLQVVGVDLDPTMVALAKEKHPLPNLAFVVGDIAKLVFEPASLDGIFDSSVLHHVTSYVGYRYENAAEALEAQATQLKIGGVLVVRDFLAPGPGTVLLDLPAEDGNGSDDPRFCSTAALFGRFAREFRSLSEAPGFAFEFLGPTPNRAGWRRYKLSLHHAVEFLLRKDYRTDWESEAREEYGYFTQQEFEAHYARLGFRMLASTPLRNPWILRNRWEGKCEIRSLDDQGMGFPATNYLIAGERVAPGEGVRFRLSGDEAPLGFLKMDHYRHLETGEVFDLVRRPFPTLDVIPYFEESGELFVLARMSYPRPIAGCLAHAEPTLDGRTPAAYVTEPISVIQSDLPLGSSVEQALKERAGIESSQIRRFQGGSIYYPSPGGIQEEVRSVLVEIEPIFLQEHLQTHSGFRTTGRVRAIEARQALRAAQVGGLPDARLELNIYDLLSRRSESFGDWIGDQLELKELSDPPETIPLMDLWEEAPRRVFEPAEASQSKGYLRHHASRFEELDAEGSTVASSVLEYIVPAEVSTNTVAVALVFKSGGRLYLGLEDRDLPAAQSFTGHSNLLTPPAWRLPRSVHSMEQAKAWIGERITQELRVEAGDLRPLGGPFHPTPGLTPESVHPLVAEVRSVSQTSKTLRWVALQEILEHRSGVKDCQLRVLAFRVAHMCADLPPSI